MSSLPHIHRLLQVSVHRIFVTQYPHHQHTMANDTKGYALQPISGKGLGHVALRPIHAGETILSEAPLITQSIGYSQDTIAWSLCTLSADNKRRYLTLANCHGDKYPPLLGIYKTNTLPCGVNDEVARKRSTKSGLFLEGSRFNSSCVPNVRNTWDERRQVINFIAGKDIAEGEELCIAYGNLLAPRSERRSKLATSFGFECTCAACSLSGAALEKSDARRERLGVLYDEVADCGNSPRLGVQKAKEALRLLGEEQLITYTDTFAYDAYQFCAIASDLRHAKEWIKQAYKAAAIMDGIDGEETLQFLGYVKNPRAHPSWGLGRKMLLQGP